MCRCALNPVLRAFHKKQLFLVACPCQKPPKSMPVPVLDDRPGHQQTAWMVPANMMLSSINTAISETGEKPCVSPLSCEQDACVAWDYGGRSIVLDISETLLSAELAGGETKAPTPRIVSQTVDQEGNIIYQWYDQDGHLHTLSEWEFRLRLSMYFQSWLEFLYPEYFGSSLPAGGGWHHWQYWKVRRTMDRPGDSGQQPWQTRKTRRKTNMQRSRPVTVAQPVPQTRFTANRQRHQNGGSSAPGKTIKKTTEDEIDLLLKEFESDRMQQIAARFSDRV